MITALMPPNFIVVEDILPHIPEDRLKALEGVAWGDATFTTFSICDTRMLEYEITSEGFIYVTKEDGGIEKLNYTGEIEFNTLITLPEKDCELDFKALFYKGELESLDLEGFREIDSAPRKEATDKLMEMIRVREERAKKWWYKFYLFYIKCVVFVFSCIRWLFGLVIKLAWMIQNKIT